VYDIIQSKHGGKTKRIATTKNIENEQCRFLFFGDVEFFFFAIKNISYINKIISTCGSI
jgi:hypothetical protein